MSRHKGSRERNERARALDDAALQGELATVSTQLRAARRSESDLAAWQHALRAEASRRRTGRRACRRVVDAIEQIEVGV